MILNHGIDQRLNQGRKEGRNPLLNRQSLKTYVFGSCDTSITLKLCAKWEHNSKLSTSQILPCFLATNLDLKAKYVCNNNIYALQSKVWGYRDGCEYVHSHQAVYLWNKELCDIIVVLKPSPYYNTIVRHRHVTLYLLLYLSYSVLPYLYDPGLQDDRTCWFWNKQCSRYDEAGI